MKNQTRIMILAAALAFAGCLQTFAQELPKILWDKTIGGNFAEGLSRIYPAPDGGWYLFGTSSSSPGFEKSAPPYTLFGKDIWVMKYNSSWVKEWDKVFGGTDDENLSRVLRTDDGGFIMMATSLSDKSGDKSEDAVGSGFTDIWVLEIDANGNKIWDKTYGGADHDDAGSMYVHPWGGYLISGTSYSGKSGDKTHDSFGKQDFWVFRIDDTGKVLWDKVFGGERFDTGPGIYPLKDGFILTGVSDSPISGNKTQDKRGSDDAWMVKIDFSGNKIWDKAYGGVDNENGAGISIAHGGGYILSITSKSGISGDKTTPDFGANDAWFVKVDSNFNIEWDKTIGTVYQDYLGAGRSGDGGYLLSGRHVIEEDHGGGIIQKGDRWMMHYDDKLETMDWEWKFGGDKNETGGSGWRMEDDTTKILMGNGSDSDISGDKTEDSRGGMDYWLTMIQMPFGLYTSEKPLQELSNITVYPNPVIGDEVYFVSDKHEISEVIIYTLTGAMVKSSSNLFDKRARIRIADLSPGIYITTIKTRDGRMVNQKLIKQ